MGTGRRGVRRVAPEDRLSVFEHLHELRFLGFDQLHVLVAANLAGDVEGVADAHRRGVADVFINRFHALGDDGFAICLHYFSP